MHSCTCCTWGLELESIDISSAFLNGDLEEEVYMEQPEGFHQGAYDDFLQLLKGLYGLHQSPCIWHKNWQGSSGDRVHQKSGMTTALDYQKDNGKIIIPVFVDDMTLASKSKEPFNMSKLNWKHASNFGPWPTTFLLGVGVEHDRMKRVLHLSQCSTSKISLSNTIMQTAPLLHPNGSRYQGHHKQHLQLLRDWANEDSALHSCCWLTHVPCCGHTTDIAYAVGVLDVSTPTWQSSPECSQTPIPLPQRHSRL